MIGTFLSWKVSGNGASVRSIYFRKFYRKTNGERARKRGEKINLVVEEEEEGQSTQIPRYSTTIRKIREGRSSSKLDGEGNKATLPTTVAHDLESSAFNSPSSGRSTRRSRETSFQFPIEPRSTCRLPTAILTERRVSQPRPIPP